MFKLTDDVRTKLTDAALLWDTAHRISAQTMVGFSREESQSMHGLRKKMLAASMDILRKMASSGQDEAAPQLAVVPPSSKGARASGTTRRATSGAADQADEPVKVV